MKEKVIQCICSYWHITISLLGICVLGVYNFCKYRSGFFKMSIVDCLTLGIAVIVASIFVRKENNVLRKKEIYFSLLSSLQDIISSDSLYIIKEDTTKEKLTMTIRKIRNQASRVNLYGNQFGLKKENEIISKEIKEYIDFVSDHITDIEYLSKSQNQLKRPLDIINDKLFEMMMKLYS